MTLFSTLILLSLATSTGNLVDQEPELQQSLNETDRPKCGHIKTFPTYTSQEKSRFNNNYDDDNSYDDDVDDGHLDKILGGSYASQGEIPWQAAVLENGKMICSATIVSEFWLIGAAHCFSEHDTSDYTITVGDHRLRYEDLLEQSFKVKRIVSHELFDWDSSEHDIALILIKATSDGRGIPFNSHIQPVCLAKSWEMAPDDTLLTVSGWGVTSPSNQLSVILKKASLPIITNDECKQVYQRAVTPNVFCAGQYTDKAEACTGDSGGPAVYTRGEHYILYGIHSTGVPKCGEPVSPGIYTSIPAHRIWIDTTIRFHSSGSEGIIPYRHL